MIAINRVRKMQLELVEEVDPETGDITKPAPLSDFDLWEAAKLLEKMEEKQADVRGVMLVEDPVESPEAQRLRERVIADYTNVIFRDRVWPNPPVRGQHGPAKLYLKPGAKPVCGRTITLSGERLAAMRELEEEWRADGKLEASRGAWRSAAFPIRKKNNKWRGVVDFNKANAEIQDDSYPLPKIPEIQVQQGGCHIVSVVDLRDAFHQVYLDSESRPITSTQLPGGLFQWTVVPQGIKVGPPLLQRDIDATCAPVGQIARPYFDDICIGTRKVPGMSEEDLLKQHDEDLRKVFAQLAAHKWVSNPAKCVLFAKTVEFCGHVMGNGIIRPSPGKLLAVQKFEPPPTITALRGFLGLCNHYSAYVKMYAEYAAPLQEKLKVPKDDAKAGSKAKVHWSPEDLAAFERLKAALMEGLELYHLDTSKPFVLRTDASDYAIVAALEQFPELEGMPTTAGILRTVCNFLSRIETRLAISLIRVATSEANACISFSNLAWCTRSMSWNPPCSLASKPAPNACTWACIRVSSSWVICFLSSSNSLAVMLAGVGPSGMADDMGFGGGRVSRLMARSCRLRTSRNTELTRLFSSPKSISTVEMR
jgi:hypothetical protein